MANTLKIKRGTAATIPQGQLAEPLFTTDTYDLYIGKGASLGNQRFQKYIASGTSSDFIKGDGTLDSTTYQATSEKGQNNGYASLDAGGKIPAAQLPSSVIEYKGTWNASTNTPTLADGTGDAGDVYIVSVGGTQNLGSGSITFAVGDWVMYNGSIWQKSTGSNAVASVNGQTGVVTITFDQLSPMTTLGDTIYGAASGAGTRLAGNITVTKKFLSQTGTGTASAAPSWQTVTQSDVGLSNVENTALSTWAGSANITTLGTITSGTWNGTTIAIANGGTGQTTKAAAFNALSPMTTLGDIIYGGASGAGTRLAGNTTASKRFLIQTGDGTNSAAPSWGSIAAGDVPDLSATYLPLAGGTLTGGLSGTTGTFSGVVQSSAIKLTDMTAGSGALYYNTSAKRLTLANYNADGILMFEVNGGNYAMSLNADLTMRLWGYTTNGFVKFSSSNGTLAVDTNTYAIISSPTQDTIAYWVNNTTIGSLATATYPSLAELSYVKGVTSSIQTQIDSKATKSSPTSNTITYWVDANTIGSLATSSYPSLTELSYVKGVTSAIQTQIDGKLSLSGGTLTGALNGTSATFSGKINANTAGTVTSSFADGLNLGSWDAIGYNSAGTDLVIGGYRSSQWSGVQIYTSGASRLTISSTGASTFSSSVTVNNSGGVPSLNVRATDANFALASIFGNQTGDVNWLLMSGYPNAGDFTIRQSDVVNALTIAKTTGAATFSSSISATSATFSSSVQATNIGVGYAPQSNIGAFIYQNSTNYALAVQQDGSGVPFQVTSGAVVRMYVANGGNVGIGTTSPSQKLEVAGVIRGEAVNVYSSTDPASTSPYLFSPSLGALGFGGNGSERMRITSGGNVGIGTTSPAAKLEVVGDTITQDLYAVKGGDVADAGGSIFFKTGTNGTYSPMSQIKGVLLNATPSEQQGGIAFFTRPSGTAGQTLTERVRITAAGNVGIGTNNPSAKLTINSSSDDATGTQSLYIAGAKSGFAGYNGLWQNQLFVYDNSATATGVGGAISFGGNAGGGQTTWFGSIEGFKENATSGDYGGALVFRTRTNLVAIPAEKMRITSGGNVGVNCTGSNAKLEVVATTGEVFRADAASGAYRIIANQTNVLLSSEVLIGTTTDSGAYALQVNGSVYATAYYESSDIRLKDVLTNSYSENFSAIEFIWKDKRDDKKHWGYAAQDVMKYIPDAIEVNKDGMMTVNYNEAHTWKIAQLEAKIVELEAKVK